MYAPQRLHIGALEASGLSPATTSRRSIFKPHSRVVVVHASEQRGNVIPGFPHAREYAATGAKTMKQMVEMEARRRLQEEDGWFVDNQDAPGNMIIATSPTHFKSIITSASPSKIIIVDFFSPSCHACKSMWPKMKQIAANNQDVVFVQVNTAVPSLMELAKGLQVAKLPWFMIYQPGGDQLASFTCNLNNIDALRAEIAAHTRNAPSPCSV